MHEGHLPVLVDEVIEMLAPAPGSLHIDATLGGGGHTERILEAANPDGRLLGLDADPAAIARVEARLSPRYGDRLVLRQANFRELADVAPTAGFGAVDGAEAGLRRDPGEIAEVRLAQDEPIPEPRPQPRLDPGDRQRVGVEAEDSAVGIGGLQDPLGVPTAAQGGIDVKAAGGRCEHLDDLVHQHRQVPFVHLSSIPDESDPERILEAHMVGS